MHIIRPKKIRVKIEKHQPKNRIQIHFALGKIVNFASIQKRLATSHFQQDNVMCGFDKRSCVAKWMVNDISNGFSCYYSPQAHNHIHIFDPEFETKIHTQAMHCEECALFCEIPEKL